MPELARVLPACDAAFRGRVNRRYDSVVLTKPYPVLISPPAADMLVTHGVLDDALGPENYTPPESIRRGPLGI